MKLFLIIAFSFFIQFGHGQDTLKLYALIDTFSNRTNGNEFIISESMWPGEMKRLKGALKPKIVDNSGDSILLTNDELTYLNAQLELTDHFHWEQRLFKNAKIIPFDTLRHQRLYGQYWFFSKPIFIRDNSICLFYYIFYCGNTCGHSQLAFYRWRNNKWTKWIHVIGGKG